MARDLRFITVTAQITKKEEGILVNLIKLGNNNELGPKI